MSAIFENRSVWSLVLLCVYFEQFCNLFSPLIVDIEDSYVMRDPLYCEPASFSWWISTQSGPCLLCSPTMMVELKTFWQPLRSWCDFPQYTGVTLTALSLSSPRRLWFKGHSKTSKTWWKGGAWPWEELKNPLKWFLNILGHFWYISNTPTSMNKIKHIYPMKDYL